jgi:hypothetical protein
MLSMSALRGKAGVPDRRDRRQIARRAVSTNSGTSDKSKRWWLHDTRVRRPGLPCALDEMFELIDHELLITDNAFHHVANRNYTN